MKMTVAIATYNRCESLSDTLAALNQQVLPAGLQLDIVVVDNGSADRTREVVMEALRVSRWPLRYHVEPQRGAGYAKNRAIQHAQGELIAFLDDDAIPTPAWAQEIHHAFVTLNADCVGGKILPLWLGAPPAWLLNDRVKRLTWGMLALLDRGSEPLTDVRWPEHTDPLYGANMACRKSLFREMGGFRHGVRADEFELVRRLFAAGKRIVYAPEAVVQHKVGVDRMRVGYFRRLSFRIGQDKARESGKPVRFWLVRECVGRGIQALGAYCRNERIEGIAHELRFWGLLGWVWGALS